MIWYQGYSLVLFVTSYGMLIPLICLLHSLRHAIKDVWLSVLDGLAVVIGLEYLHIMELVIWVAGFILYICIMDAGYWLYSKDFQKYFVICSYWVMLAGLRICSYCYLGHKIGLFQSLLYVIMHK